MAVINNLASRAGTDLFDLSPLDLDEMHRPGVHAISLPSRSWPVIENVAEMSSASGAFDLLPAHAETAIDLGLHVIRGNWRPEARPTRSRIELCIR